MVPTALRIALSRMNGESFETGFEIWTNTAMYKHVTTSMSKDK